MGLISILYPDQYYAILADNDEYGINIHITKTYGVREKHRIRMKFDMLAGDINKIIKNVNNNLTHFLNEYNRDLHPQVLKDLLKDKSIIRWNDIEERTEIKFKRGVTEEEMDADSVKKINIRFKRRLAPVLGFRNDILYTIYSKSEDDDDVGNSLSSFQPTAKCGVEYIYLYTDIIQPTNFGGQLVNILDCFSLENGGNKGIHNSVYKPLNTSILDQISIIVTDQHGRAIHFREGSTLTCVLHIRPK